MQDEEMDHMDELIREASNSYHPAYDDKAWEKMEALLDKHLPQKKDRKRPAFLLWLGLLIGGAIFFAMLFPWNNKGTLTVGRTEPKQSAPILRNIPVNNQPVQKAALAKDTKKSKYLSPDILSDREGNALNRNFKKIPAVIDLTRNNDQVKSAVSARDFEEGKEVFIKDDINLPEKQVGLEENTAMTVPLVKTTKDQHMVNALPPVTNTPFLEKDAGSVTKKTTDVPVSKSSPASVGKRKVSKRFADNFAVRLSAGPDLSFVGLDNSGKTKLNYGAGLSYTFANRITLSSGFYVARKIYSAQASDYHPPLGYWTYTADLLRVDADCKVYEIPLSAAYNFGQSKKHNWFASVGISSLLMKRETYNYLYKDAWGQIMYKGWTLLDANKHYFSVLTISGGYQYRVNHKFSIIAEPYFKMPLYGIGFGKIKLNAGGLLITASIKPFAKSK